MATKEYPNFYENIKEANMRLQHTVVLYDGTPYYVLCICDGHADGIFRVYLAPTGHPKGLVVNRLPMNHEWPGPGEEKMKMMDDTIKKNPDEGILRKHMNSPLFNKFRPFPLGMCNVDGKTIYVERQPQRHTHQGLTNNMLFQSHVALDGNKLPIKNIDVTSPPLSATILGVYPDVHACLKNLKDPDVMNDSVGFHRHFAFVRGPIGTMFLAYKTDVIGILPDSDLTSVKLSDQFKHTKEVVEELGIFNRVLVKQ